jgi:spore coat protein U-like protein
MEPLNMRKPKNKEKGMKKTLLAVMVVAILAMAGAAFAASATTNLTVTANVANICTISTNPGNVDFGTYDPTSLTDNATGQTSFRYKCTRGTSYKVYITRTNQMLKGGLDPLNYELYSDTSRTNVFPKLNAEASGQTSANNGEVTMDIYGKIPHSQNVEAGVHTEIDVITIEY